jgi:hypothetical protein
MLSRGEVERRLTEIRQSYELVGFETDCSEWRPGPRCRVKDWLRGDEGEGGD